MTALTYGEIQQLEYLAEILDGQITYGYHAVANHLEEVL